MDPNKYDKVGRGLGKNLLPPIGIDDEQRITAACI